jgi:HSP20 family protein
MPMDAWRRGDTVEVAFDLPGIDPGTRHIVLADGVDLDKIEARYENGVLFVTAPVAETARPHRIEIKGANGHGKAITAGSSRKTTAA